MSRQLRSFATIEEWDSAFFPDQATKVKLANFGKDPAVLAGILAEEALQHATAQLTSIKKPKRPANQVKR